MAKNSEEVGIDQVCEMVGMAENCEDVGKYEGWEVVGLFLRVENIIIYVDLMSQYF